MSAIPPHIFKAYDIRGLAPVELTEEVAYRVGRVFASAGASYVVGQDMRATSAMLAEAVMRGIRDAGADVLDIGLVATPTCYFAVRTLPCAGGIQVTASHNPATYNGLKLVRRTADAIEKVGMGSGMETVRDAVIGWTHPPPEPQRGARRTLDEVVTREVEDVLAQVPLPAPPSLMIVADTGNGMGAPFLDALFSRLEMPLNRMYFELDGSFPHHPPDPLQADTLRDLQARVRATGADLGIATDGDADRIFFLDERGEIIPASFVTALVATELLREHPGARMLADVRYTRNAAAAIRGAGGHFGLSRVGHARISAQLREEHGIFAGESSGHFFFRGAGYAESPLLVILYVLRALVRERVPVSALFGQFRVSEESGEVNFHLADPTAVARCLTALRMRYADAEQSDLDGLSIEYPDWRCNVRASNTESLLRVNVEGIDAALVAAQRDEVMGVITACTT